MYGLRHWLIETFRLEDENDYQDKICLLRFFPYCPRPSLPSVATDDWKPSFNFVVKKLAKQTDRVIIFGLQLM